MKYLRVSKDLKEVIVSRDDAEANPGLIFLEIAYQLERVADQLG